jgi:hypothetical protein
MDPGRHDERPVRIRLAGVRRCEEVVRVGIDRRVPKRRADPTLMLR